MVKSNNVEFGGFVIKKMGVEICVVLKTILEDGEKITYPSISVGNGDWYELFGWPHNQMRAKVDPKIYTNEEVKQLVMDYIINNNVLTQYFEEMEW